MIYRRSPLSQRSEKKKLRDDIGKLHFQILKKERGIYDRCEICGKQTGQLGRFHIIRVARAPRLEFEDQNVLLAGWFCCHFAWHHHGSNDLRNKATEECIMQICGTEYIQKLLTIEKYKQKHDLFYLRLLYLEFTKRLEGLQ